jgi:hypothetical protein
MVGHGLDSATRLRRMRGVLQALDKIDLDTPDLRIQVELLKHRATRALQDTKMEPGDPVHLAGARVKAKLAHKRKGRATAERVLPIVKTLRVEGFKTYAALAAELNKRGVRPPAASIWSPSTVYAVANRPPWQAMANVPDKFDLFDQRTEGDKSWK